MMHCPKYYQLSLELTHVEHLNNYYYSFLLFILIISIMNVTHNSAQSLHRMVLMVHANLFALDNGMNVQVLKWIAFLKENLRKEKQLEGKMNAKCII